MLRKFIFKDTATGEELVLPVTPKMYEIEHGRRVNSLTMQESGEINLPGPKALLDTELECLLPAREYPFALPGYGGNPWAALERLELWSDAGRVLRFIVSDTPVNAAVILGPIRYREQDGTNDVYAVIPIRGYRQLEATPSIGAASTATARAVEGEPERQETYTVVAGDTLGAIARRFYGDAALAARLAAANGVKNVNLIHPGQVLKLPPKDQLPPASTGSTGGVKSTKNTGTAAVIKPKLTVLHSALSGQYVGTCAVAVGGVTYDMKSGERELTVTAPLPGAAATIRWSSQGGHSWTHIKVDGKVMQPSTSKYTAILMKNTEVVIYWVK